MIEFATEIARFGLQSAIIVAGLLIVIAFAASILSKDRQGSELKVKNLNKQMEKHRSALLKKQLTKKEIKKHQKELKSKDKKSTQKKSLFVLDFNGDIKASATAQLRQEVSTILNVAKEGDEILVKLESPGGMVHGYGFAASQLDRIKKANIPLTICVDKIAASGGYMMACLANKIVAAPFAIIGSIGVVASMPNFNKILKKNDVDYLEITAGEFKRTLTPLGEVTEPGMKKFKDQIQEVHDLFKSHVSQYRPQVDIGQVATGEYWYGQQAEKLKLVDELGTSDDFLMSKLDQFSIFEVKFAAKKSIKEKLGESLSFQIETVSTKVADQLWSKRFF